ncbi:MAG: epoxyqueuosine reductase [Clostridia bacterium]|nr:epoxyqueuosine reductase [Clostridia bacterium]MDR3644399.1 epoxyqueuosine reductase [Clostridia bacterium]
MSISDEIKSLLHDEGCSIVGFADLRCLSKDVRQNFDYGVLIALSYSKEAMKENKDGHPEQYYAEYTQINKRLPQLAAVTADYLVGKGCKALARVQTSIVVDEDCRTVLPHKTVATLSGIGWIGKCATLVTKEVGSALRLTVVLTDAPLDCGTPITESLCADSCTICAGVCPGHAPLGGKWHAGMDRDLFFDAHACQSAARAHAKAALGISKTVCGLCISSCPFTKKALGYQ